ncbi:Na+/H+ antiporter subunit E [Pseudoroseicyclus tamaricis]|uniref:Na+/H+ antiporter subunit E n=1 Tax=Pseudoroseicyclus tamaricis TaxID=2705421 RepID=A0A6B2JKJ1_9RHOB|nr:Na+/H+ antiporter subunit E [Pseudoroseicyclus tamaricis]NDV02011.1 Na+/H+ antiporter subunit E [Pseudoroseicyclus tamaricis]
MIKRLFPHPLLSLMLVLIWLLLVNKITTGNLLLGVLLSFIVPAVTEPYWPNRARLKKPLLGFEYVAVVLWDIIVANVQVALIVLFKPQDKINSQWVTVPLDLTSPEAITVLAGTITLTPGTVTAMLSADAGCLLVHCLHTDDPEAVRDEIKHRYERRLKELFQ